MKCSIIKACFVGMMLPYCFSTAMGQPPHRERSDTIIHEDKGSPTATVTTYGRRPLEDALRLIGRTYGWAINYEDAPVVNSQQIVDDNAELRLKYPDLAERALFPRGNPFTTTFSEDHARHADIEQVLKRVIQDYNQSGNPGHYEVERTTLGNYLVVGDSYESQSGARRKYTPILNCKISITIPALSLHDALQMIGSEIGKTCKDSQLNTDYAAEIGTQGQVFGTYQDVPARDVIEQLLSQETTLMFYTVDYMPGENQYNLYTWVAYKSGRSMGGNEVLVPLIRNGGGETN
jgi:hypothetical protein